LKKLVYKEYPRAYGKSEVIRVAEKILGLRVEEILLKVAEAVRTGAPPRVVDGDYEYICLSCYTLAADATYEEMKGGQ